MVGLKGHKMTKGIITYLNQDLIKVSAIIITTSMMIYAGIMLSGVLWLYIIGIAVVMSLINALNENFITKGIDTFFSIMMLYLIVFLVVAAGVSIFQRATSTKTTYASVPFTLTDASFSTSADMLVTGNTYLGKITVEATPKFAENVKDGCKPTLLVSQINYKGNWSPDYRAILTCDEGKEFRLSREFIK